MFRISTYSRFLKPIAFTLLVAGLAIAQAPAGPRRPAAVPGDFVITPFGYFHPSCVNHLAKSDVLQLDRKAIQHANGTSSKIQCAYPHYDSDGTEITADEPALPPPPSIGHSHVETVTATTTSAYGAMDETFLVPPPPIDNDGQTLYFYFGLQDLNDVVTVLQPVVGWNADFSGSWGMASWNCCVAGAVNESSPLQVDPGDEIIGQIQNTCGPPPNDKKACSSWNVFAIDNTLEALLDESYATGLSATSSYGQTFNWAFGAVMEVYNIQRCQDYPSSSRLSFYELYLYNYKYEVVNPKWTTNVASGLSPVCGYGGGPRTQLTLDFAF
jgi:hypothetical protein